METKKSLTNQDREPQQEGVGRGGRTAADIKELHSRYKLNKSALKQIPIVDEGERLQQGGTYIDLRDEEPESFTATSEQKAEDGSLLVRKSDVAYEIWNHLIGEEKPGEEFDESPTYEKHG